MSRCDHGFELSVVPCPDGCQPNGAPPLSAPRRGNATRIASDAEIKAALEQHSTIADAARAVGMQYHPFARRVRRVKELRLLMGDKFLRANGKRQPRFVDMKGRTVSGPSGSTFTVLREAPSINGNTRWWCQHSCGGPEVALEGIRLRSEPPRYCDHCRPKRPGTVQRRTT